MPMKTARFTKFLAVLTFASVVSMQAQEAETKPGKPSSAISAPGRPFKNIDVGRFDQLLQSKTNVVLDVRTRGEYEEGHLPGAVLIDFTEDNFDAEVAKLDKSKTYLVHCAVGGRSARACKKMEKAGFTNLYNLQGGLTAWEKAGKPLEK